MWNENGEVTSTYIKRALTPFGEYIPLRALSEFVSPLSKNVTDFVGGDKVVTHTFGTVKASPIICYELIDDATVSTSVNGSNLMLVQTNNSTFANSAQSMQQLNISRIRAIENNRWLVSVSTTGVSAVVDNLGNIVSKTKQNEASYLYESVNMIENRSIASRLDSFSWIVLVLSSLLIYYKKRSYDV
jgi:apolipoprotein N-acyltransferase